MQNNRMIELDTPVELLGLEPRLLTRLKLFEVSTFQELMLISPTDWDNVSPKVVNALKRYQTVNKSMFNRLRNGGKPDTPIPSNAYADAMLHAPRPLAQDPRFFVANNLLNAYASSGQLKDPNRPLEETLDEIMNITDLFLQAYDKQKPIEVPEEDIPSES